MTQQDRCPQCGALLSEGVCPCCLIRQRIDGAESGRSFLSSRADSTEVTGELRPRASVLDSITVTIGSVPRVLLRDTGPGEQPGPVVRPQRPDSADPTIRYRIDGEIARGGMGIVLKGRDPDLGRDVVLKVLREDHRDNLDMVRRFIEEAQIGGQLQHPGIVPIYELGTFIDRRPFFSMKLVKGHTLADLLEHRSSPADELTRFLTIYEAFSQTVAYAHARGVIHRDLKPANVMVGSFGEVQVMDWGLAKVLPRGGVVNEAQDDRTARAETVIATARSRSDAPELSHAGSVMGTPSYMAPEQARGETDRIDERADVFALGSVLCEILTGKPTFLGRSSGEIQRTAALGETADAMARLDGCGADAELVTLAKHCLAREPEDRPRSAGPVAKRVTAYLAGVQQRLQETERQRAVAVARAVEERRRHKVQLGLAAALLAFTMLGVLSTTYYLQQRQAQAAAMEQSVGRAVSFRDQAAAHSEEVAGWQVALAAMEQAEAAAGGAAPARACLLALRTEIQASLDAAQRDRALLDKLVEIRIGQGR